MRPPLNYAGVWRKKRYNAAKQVGRMHILSKGARQFWSFVCLTYADKDTGCFWTSTETLAKDLGVGKRTIQRYAAELQSAGLMVRVRIPRKRRAFQLAVPGAMNTGHEPDSEPAKASDSNPTGVTREPDRSDVAYYEPCIEPVKAQPFSRPLSFVLVGKNETAALDAWRTYLEGSGLGDPDQLLELCRSGSTFHLPSRIPKSDEGHGKRYGDYFRLVLRNSGQENG